MKTKGIYFYDGFYMTDKEVVGKMKSMMLSGVFHSKSISGMMEYVANLNAADHWIYHMVFKLDTGLMDSSYSSNTKSGVFSSMIRGEMGRDRLEGYKAVNGRQCCHNASAARASVWFPKGEPRKNRKKMVLSARG